MDGLRFVTHPNGRLERKAVGDLIDGRGAVVASIENQPGKQGSLAVYQYLKQVFDTLDAKASEHG